MDTSEDYLFSTLKQCTKPVYIDNPATTDSDQGDKSEETDDVLTSLHQQVLRSKGFGWDKMENK